MPIYPLITRDPATGGELLVTRLETVDGALAIEGRFSLGWVGQLTAEQLDFVGVLLRNRNNLQRLANELGVAYNTARARLDEVVAALGGDRGETEEAPDEVDGETSAAIDALAAGQIAFDEALARLKSRRR